MVRTMTDRMNDIETRMDGPDGIETRLARIEERVEHVVELQEKDTKSVLDKITADNATISAKLLEIQAKQVTQDAKVWQVVMILLGAAGLGTGATKLIELISSTH